MKAEQLRKSILQLAIQGKLVPQDTNDEPASVLLEKIRAEKENLIKQGKIKKDKNDSVISKGEDGKFYEKIGKEVKDITEEINFDLPSGWEFIRLSTIAELGSGFTPKANELTSKGKVPYFKVSDMNLEGNEKYLIKTNLYYVGNIEKTWSNGTIVFPKNGGAVFTNKKRILIKESVVDLNTGTFKPSKHLYFDYVYLLFQSIDFRKHFKGTALPTINSSFMNTLLFALPPYNEQKRIVEAIEKFEPLLAEYEKLEQQATKFDNEIFDKLKKSVLQYAIQGKLVPQDSSDEPASVLLAKIKAEKESLIKQGKIKKEKPQPPIADDEKTFDIPDNWEWVRWGDLSESIQYGYNAPAKSIGRIKMVRISDISENNVNWEKVPFCDIAAREIENYLLRNNDILFARTGGTVGKSYLVKNIEEDAIYAGYLIRTRYNNMLCPEYLKFFMESNLYWMQLKEGTIATAQPNCNGKTLSKMILPLPPLNEQKRIVARIEEIFAQIDKVNIGNIKK